VARAVDVRVVARFRLVLDVRDGDRDAALALFRSLVDLVERPTFTWGLVRSNFFLAIVVSRLSSRRC
jgi:hypothetical protein